MGKMTREKHKIWEVLSRELRMQLSPYSCEAAGAMSFRIEEKRLLTKEATIESLERVKQWMCADIDRAIEKIKEL